MNFKREFDLAGYITTVMPFLKHAEQKIYLYLWARQQEANSPVCVTLTEMACGRKDENDLLFDCGAGVSKKSAVGALKRLQRLKLVVALARSQFGTVWNVEVDFSQIERQYLHLSSHSHIQNWVSSGVESTLSAVEKVNRQRCKKYTFSDEKSDPTLYLKDLKRGNKSAREIKFAVNFRGNFHGEAEMREIPADPCADSTSQFDDTPDDMPHDIPCDKIVKFLLDEFGKTALAQQPTALGEKTLNCAREWAINLLGMGYDSFDAIQAILAKWRKEHWAGQRNGTPSQFLEFASSQMQSATLDDAETTGPEPIIARSQNSYWSGLFQGGQS